MENMTKKKNYQTNTTWISNCSKHISHMDIYLGKSPSAESKSLQEQKPSLESDTRFLLNLVNLVPSVATAVQSVYIKVLQTNGTFGANYEFCAAINGQENVTFVGV